MPKGPNGQKRPGDVVGAAIMISRVATGEIKDNTTALDNARHSAGGKKGGPARSVALTPDRRSAFAAIPAVPPSVPAEAGQLVRRGPLLVRRSNGAPVSLQEANAALDRGRDRDLDR